MANLRSLIGSVAVEDIKPIAEGCSMYFAPHCTCYCNSDYSGNCFLYWCAPENVTCMKFEVWGGGGSGAGSCCCMGGTPGGSGAWAYKCLNTTDGDFAAGDCYALYPGPPTCCARCCCGILGCKGYITGTGLTNFCADGGNAGQSCCFVHWGAFNCYGNNCGYYYTNRMCCQCCRCHYGSDGGTPGRPSAIWAQCTCGSCYWKLLFHYPGGINNTVGGFTTTQQQGNACNSEWSRCTKGGLGWSAGSEAIHMPGTGGPSASACGGGCCYGFPGASGLVRITWNEN